MKTHSKLSSSILALLGSIAISHAETVTWDGTTSGDAIWTDADSNSWSGGQYDNGDDAQFLGDGAGTVTLSGTITPNSVLVNSANDYDFTGVLSGGGSLTKDGTGILTLSSQNTYSGGTTVNNGTLNLDGGAKTLQQFGTLTVDGASSLVQLGPTVVANNIIDNMVVNIQNGGTVDDTTASGVVHSMQTTTFTNGGTLSSTGTGYNGTYGNYFFNGDIAVNGNAAATIDADAITLNGAGRLITVDDVTADANADLTISSIIKDWANPSTINKNGAGTLVLSGANTYTGATNVNGGVLEAQGGSAIGNSSAVTVNALGTFEVDNAETIGSLTGAGDVTLNANLTMANNASQALSGDISGSGTLIKGVAGASGTGTLALSGDNSAFSGGITMNNAGGNNGGTLSLNSANASGTGDLTFNHFTRLYNGVSGPSTISNNLTTGGGSWFFWESGSKALDVTGTWNNSSSVVWLNSAETLTVSGVVSGTASTGFYGGGTLALTNANNNFTGNYNATLDSTIQFNTIADSGVNSSLGAGTEIRFDAGNQSFNGYFENIGAGGSTNRAITIGSTTADRGAGIANNGTGALDFSGTFTNDASSGGTRTLLLGGDYAGENTISSVLSDGAGGGKIALTKEGSTTWTLSGTNTYTGATTVTDGTLIINGDHSGATGEINVSGTGILGGSGTLASMTVALGGAMSPGNSPGTQTIADLTWGDGGSYIWEVNDSNGSEGADPGWDWIDVTTSFDLSGLSAGGFTIDITSLTTGNVAGLAAGFDYSGLEYGDPFATSFTILTLASGNITGFDAGDFVLDDGNFVNGKLEWSLDAVGADLVLSAVFVPEPSSTALLGLGGLALMLRRKRSAA